VSMLKLKPRESGVLRSRAAAILEIIQLGCCTTGYVMLELGVDPKDRFKKHQIESGLQFARKSGWIRHNKITRMWEATGRKPLGGVAA